MNQTDVTKASKAFVAFLLDKHPKLGKAPAAQAKRLLLALGYPEDLLEAVPDESKPLTPQELAELTAKAIQREAKAAKTIANKLAARLKKKPPKNRKEYLKAIGTLANALQPLNAPALALTLAVEDLFRTKLGTAAVLKTLQRYNVRLTKEERKQLQKAIKLALADDLEAAKKVLPKKVSFEVLKTLRQAFA